MCNWAEEARKSSDYDNKRQHSRRTAAATNTHALPCQPPSFHQKRDLHQYMVTATFCQGQVTGAALVQASTFSMAFANAKQQLTRSLLNV
jgi:hypothetical protein